MESNGQSKITKWKQSHGYREQTNSCQRRRVWGLVGRVKGLSKEKKEKLMDTDNTMVTARGKWVGKVEEGKGGE